MSWSLAAWGKTLRKVFFVAALPMMPLAHQANAHAQGIPLLGPEDTAIAIDLDALFVGPFDNGRYPAAEGPAKAIDGIVSIPGPPPSFSKYLNFGGAGSGFIVSPRLADIPVDGFQITTANDAPARDPSSYELYGRNGPLTTTDSGPSPAINQTGLAEAWTLIASGPLSLPGDPMIGGDQRGVAGPMVKVGSSTDFNHYKMVFPTIKDPAANIMQIAEIQFFADFSNPRSGFLQPTDAIIAVDQTPTPASWQGSSYPNDQSPALGIDQSRDLVTNLPDTKYLNFGEERSGIIISNSDGPVGVDIMRLTTADNAAERDPSSYELYGTNDPILSVDKSDSAGGEVWTLISNGALSLPAGRSDDSTLVPINASAMYSSYRLIFPTVKNATTANSMQIADIQFYTAPVQGDYNANGVVDAADYVVWRDTLGQIVPPGTGADGFANGEITQLDYVFWKERFGNTDNGGSGIGANAAVPEPATLVLIFLAAAGIGLRDRHIAQQVPRIC